MNIKSQIPKSKSHDPKTNYRWSSCDLGFVTWDLNSGFTLIELLIVIVIIGILSTFVIANLIGIRARARDAQRKTDLRQIQTALQLYNADQGSYPEPGTLDNCGNGYPFTGTNGTTVVTYMQTIPCDPLDKTTPYVYTPTGNEGGTCINADNGNNCTGYTLTACLENSLDSDTDQKRGITSLIDCKTRYTYTVRNP